MKRAPRTKLIRLNRTQRIALYEACQTRIEEFQQMPGKDARQEERRLSRIMAKLD